jgi:membrane-associated HD superfamily phosphohydrolase
LKKAEELESPVLSPQFYSSFVFYYHQSLALFHLLLQLLLLIVVGIMMAGSFAEINWKDIAEAIPAFFAAVLMALAYNISIGIAFGFIFYIIVKLVKKEAKEIHPIIWGSSVLFILYFVLMALKAANII